MPAPASNEDRVVFIGDSITELWNNFFPGTAYINRGISGQTTSQMLLRFRQDVVSLKPKAVVILGGTNDIAGVVGPFNILTTESNLATMVDIAKANNIKVILACLTPVSDYFNTTMTTTRPPKTILELNNWIKNYASQNKLVLLDYYSATVDSKGMLTKDLSIDGLHPSPAGYEVMSLAAQKAIDQALK